MVTGHNFLNDTYEDAIAQTLRAGWSIVTFYIIYKFPFCLRIVVIDF